MFRFLHAADLHLDSPMKGLSRYEGAPIERMRHATRRACENLVAEAIAREVSFVLIAGDVFDGDWPDYNTGLFFVGQLQRLRAAGIPVYLIRGNHDAASRITRSLNWPDNVYEFPEQDPATVDVPGLPVSIHGQSFATQAVTENLALEYPRATTGHFNIGLLHTCATGREGHESYAPCKLEDLSLKDYDYWALGHIHIRGVLQEKPRIVFSGNTQGRSVRETGAKGCYVVEVSDDRSIAEMEFVPLDVARWEKVVVDMTDVADASGLIDRVSDELRHMRDVSDGRLLAIRVLAQGETTAHAALHSDRAKWTNELRAVVNELGGSSLDSELGTGEIWLEKLELRTKPPSQAGTKRGDERDADGDGPWQELHELCEALQAAPELAASIGCTLDDLQRKLPADIRDRLAFESPEWIREVVEEAESRLRSQLLHEGNQG